MKNKTIASLLILQLFTFPCMAMGGDESSPVQIQAEQIEENNVIPSIFSKDDDPITFTIRELYKAAFNGDQKANALVEYLGEMYHDIFFRLDELDEARFSSDDQNLDCQYTLPVEHFTQKMLDEPLWSTDTTATGLEELFHPQPIRTGSTKEKFEQTQEKKSQYVLCDPKFESKMAIRQRQLDLIELEKAYIEESLLMNKKETQRLMSKMQTQRQWDLLNQEVLRRQEIFQKHRFNQ